MERYNYFDEMRASIEDAIAERKEEVNAMTDNEERYGILYDEFFCNDSITGNASGSYFFNAWKAEEAICHNLDLLAEACEEFGSDIDVLKGGAEACDVTIRCYLLGGILADVLNNLYEE